MLALKKFYVLEYFGFSDQGCLTCHQLEQMDMCLLCWFTPQKHVSGPFSFCIIQPSIDYKFPCPMKAL